LEAWAWAWAWARTCGPSLISQGLGWGELDLDPLLAHLATAPIARFPRRITMRVRESLFPQTVRDRFIEAQPRVMFWWQLV